MGKILKAWSEAVDTYKRYILGEKLNNIFDPLINYRKIWKEKMTILPTLKDILQQQYKELIEEHTPPYNALHHMNGRIKEKYAMKMLRAVFEDIPSNHLNDVIAYQLITETEEKSIEVAYNLLNALYDYELYVLSPQKMARVVYDWTNSILVSFTDIKNFEEASKIKYYTTFFAKPGESTNVWKFLKNYYTFSEDVLTKNLEVKYKAVHIDMLYSLNGNQEESIPIQFIITDKRNYELQLTQINHSWYKKQLLEFLKNKAVEKYTEKERQRALHLIEKLSTSDI